MNKLFSIAILIATLSLGGCAGWQQAINGYEASGFMAARAAEDQNLKVLTFAICATPFSAIIRNPQLVPGISALCLPAGNMTNPANLLKVSP